MEDRTAMEISSALWPSIWTREIFGISLTTVIFHLISCQNQENFGWKLHGHILVKKRSFWVNFATWRNVLSSRKRGNVTVHGNKDFLLNQKSFERRSKCNSIRYHTSDGIAIAQPLNPLQCSRIFDPTLIFRREARQIHRLNKIE